MIFRVKEDIRREGDIKDVKEGGNNNGGRGERFIIGQVGYKDSSGRSTSTPQNQLQS